MKNFENQYELDITTEPETAGEMPAPLPADTSGWDSLAGVPFAGERRAAGDMSDIPEDVSFENSAPAADVASGAYPDDIPEDTFIDGGAEILDAYPAERLDDYFPEDTGGDTQDMSKVSEWLGEINPNFDPFDTESPYCNNCGSCAYAVYQRLEGDSDICATEQNIGYNSEMEALTGMEQVSMSPEEIQSRLLAEGDGAHAIIGIDRAEGPGHWFNAACVDGKVVAIDGQSGEIMDWPPDYGDVVNWEMSVKKGA